MTLEIDRLSVQYRTRHRPPVNAVVDVSLTVEPGQVVGLVGESGCGKSTLARAAIGLLPRSAGSVKLDGLEVEPLGRSARPVEQQRFQMVFQDPYASLNPRRRVGAQIADGLRAAPRSGTSSAGVSTAAVTDGAAPERRVAELLERVGLSPSVARRFPHEFSGGQRQRIAIARALAPSPRLVIADEAVSALDASTQAQVANLLVRLTREEGAGLLFISHDLGIVRHISDKVAVMYLGRVVEQGDTDSVWAQPGHPYTEALIGAVPRHDGSGTLPVALEGDVPDPSDPPAGCRFHPRCPLRVERCDRDEPSLAPRSATHLAACWVTTPSDGELAVPAQLPPAQGT